MSEAAQEEKTAKPVDLFAGLSMSSPKADEAASNSNSTKTNDENGSSNAPATPSTQKDTTVLRSVEDSVVVVSSPATDKLLSMLGAGAAAPETPIVSNAAAVTVTVASGDSDLKAPAPTTPKRGVAPTTAPTTPSTDELFHVVTEREVREATKLRSSVPPSRVGAIAEDTPIPNSDVSLRLLRKFASKTRPSIPVKYGGCKSLGILGYLFGTSTTDDDVSLLPFSELMKIVWVDIDEDGTTNNNVAVDETDIVVESVLGGTGDSSLKARQAVASFVHVLSSWCHASQRKVDKKDAAMDLLMAHAMDTATSLVAHGCLDGVDLVISEQTKAAVLVMAESIFVTDLSQERTELAALKFLLTTGCRSTPDGEALVRGTHLLQSIRVLYHVYLTTESKANKTTARASLQQLVTSVFKRMLLTPPTVAAAESGDDATTPMEEAMMMSEDIDGFASKNHKDAFLVLRSMCKLSMRTLPDGGHSGLSSSGSSVAWDGGTMDTPSSPSKQNGGADFGSGGGAHDANKIQIVSVHAIHPALESKILALELLLYVLQNTDMSGVFLQNSGPQFQYAIRNYLCVSLLKNCTSDNTIVVNLSLRLFVPLIRNFRSHLKTEIEAFVTNVFFVILDSKHSTVEHKNLVVVLFEEICSDPQTLAEIFLNYDCDLSAVDLFHRIVNTLSRVAKTADDTTATDSSSMSFVAGAGAARMEKMRGEGRELRLEAMRALRQVLASLHASIVEPMAKPDDANMDYDAASEQQLETPTKLPPSGNAKADDEKTLVQIYDSKKKRRAEESEAVLRFNQKPSAGIKYAAQCGHVDGKDPQDVARYLLKNKDIFEKTQIGEYLGREPTYQEGFALKVLHEYIYMMDFTGLEFDDAIKYYLSGFRLPGEAQKVRSTQSRLQKD
jgi:hypothetical protein